MAATFWKEASALAWLDCAPMRAVSAPGSNLPSISAAYRTARCCEVCSSTWASASIEVTVCASGALGLPAAMSLSNASRVATTLE